MLNSLHPILQASISFNSFSLGPRFGIQTSYRDVGIPRPRNRVARMRNPSLRRSIGEKTDLVFSITFSTPCRSAMQADAHLARPTCYFAFEGLTINPDFAAVQVKMPVRKSCVALGTSRVAEFSAESGGL